MEFMDQWIDIIEQYIISFVFPKFYKLIYMK